jgi:hypothetical protein
MWFDSSIWVNVLIMTKSPKNNETDFNWKAVLSAHLQPSCFIICFMRNIKTKLHPTTTEDVDETRLAQLAAIVLIACFFYWSQAVFELSPQFILTCH